MSDLVEFLLARIAEDEEMAGGAWRDSLTADGVPSRWEYGGTAVVLAGTDDAIFQQTPLTDPAGPVVTHVARWGPRRALAECEAKRRIVAEHRAEQIASLDRETWGQVFLVCRRCRVGERQVAAPCATLRLLALPYADHDDYREEWKP